MLWGVLAALVAAMVLIGIGYATTPIPKASDVATAQATRLYYSDGKTPLGTLGDTSRVDVTLKDVPLDVRHAVLAAEDRQFYSEPGISPTGILRALYTDLRGGEISQGGSTITQQYVKNAYLTQARTFTRKFREIFIAIKLANSESKDQILQDYLNTIFFGRGAYGIQAAAKAYFGTDVSKLDAAQGAVLAALISNPTFYDPAVNADAARSRWDYVVNGMVAEHWLPAGSQSSLNYPKVRKPPKNTGSGCAGYLGFVCQDVQLELAQHGYDRARLSAGGYKVVTTIDKKAEDAAAAAMKAQGGAYQTAGVDKGREAALVSVQPGDGAIRALYGGSTYCPSQHRHPDSCTDLSGVAGSYARPPGSSFKPYTVIAALQEGISLDSTYSGPPSITLSDGTTINNSGGESCGRCTLTEALAKSVNTIFVPLAQQVGPDKIVQAAYDAGIPKARKLAEVPSITLGVTDVSPLDQAVGYATIAAQGVRAAPYLVAKVEAQDGSTVYQAKPKTQRAFDPRVMADTTFAMTKVLDCAAGGTACGKALPGRPAAGKTGTNGARAPATGNLDAWFVGFTPQLSTAVWYGNHDKQAPVTNNGAQLFGGDLPAAAWQQMMTSALEGKPVEAFPPPAHVGQAQGNTSTPSPRSSATSAPPSSAPPPTTAPPTVVPPPTTAPPTTAPPTTPPPSTPPPTGSAGPQAVGPSRSPAPPRQPHRKPGR